MPKRSASAAPDPDSSANSDAQQTDVVARFEQDLQELDSIVTQMEAGDLKLEDSLKMFERGTELARACRRSLDSAELKIRNLLEEASDEGPGN